PSPSLHSFPTRRSSDLLDQRRVVVREPAGVAVLGVAAQVAVADRLRVGAGELLREPPLVAAEQSPVERRELLQTKRLALARAERSEEHTSELQSPDHLV